MNTVTQTTKQSIVILFLFIDLVEKGSRGFCRLKNLTISVNCDRPCNPHCVAMLNAVKKTVDTAHLFVSHLKFLSYLH